mgnify:FL=1
MSLPSGYTRLQYIQSSGAQYIDTGIKGSSNLRTVCTVSNWPKTAYGTAIFGGRTSSSSTDAYGLMSAENITNYRSDYRGGKLTLSNSVSITDGIITIDKNTKVLNMSNSHLTWTNNVTATFTSSYDVYLFAYNTANTAGQYTSGAKMYSCQMYESGTLVRSFVPCKNVSGAVGMYDVVGKKFYQSGSSTAFVSGPVNSEELPYGFTEVQYIQSTGTQYIDTGIKGNSGLRVVCNISNWPKTAVNTIIFGCRTSTGSSDHFMLLCSESDKTYRSDFYNSNVAITNAISIEDAPVTIDKNKNVTTFSNMATKFTNTNGTFSSSYSLTFFAGNTQGTVGNYTNGVKLYSLQLYTDDVLVRNYIPCIDYSGNIGLYDTVTDSFFTNAGTGVFIAGPPKVKLPTGYTQLDFIQSSGTQYIDTGFVPNQNTGVLMDTIALNVASANVGSFFFGSNASSQTNAIEGYIYSDACVGVYNGIQANGTVTVSANNRLDLKYYRNYQRAIRTNDSSTVFNQTYTAATFTSPNNLNLFRLPRGFYGVLKFMSARIYDNDVLIRYFVPCRDSNGNIGLYDVIGKQFYNNSGAGTFTAGNDVVWPDEPGGEGQLYVNINGVWKQIDSITIYVK